MELTEFGRALEEDARARGRTLEEVLEHIERDATEEDRRANRLAIYRKAEEANAERGEGMTEKMTAEERKLFDAQADHEAWSLAHSILEPWVEATRVIGHDELTRVMEKALAEVEGEVNRTLDVLEPLQEPARSEPSHREVLDELAVSRGFESAEDLARRAVELDPSYTVGEILERPAGGYGVALDAVLNMSEEEKLRLNAAFVRTFLSPRARRERIEG